MTGFGIMFAVVAVFIGIVFVVVIGAIIFGLVKAGRTAAANQAAPEVNAVAMIVDKRVETHGGGESSVSQTHFVTFQQPSGERFELQVSASEYGLLVVGDRGTVAMKGTRYLGFNREIMR